MIILGVVDIAIVDSQGRIYLKEKVRKKVGIKANSVVEIIAREGEIIIRPKKSIALASKGIFKLKKRYKNVRDIDKLIKEMSLAEALSELE